MEKICCYVNYIGYAIIDYIELYIGTTLIERLTGEFIYIYNELSIDQSKKRGYREMVGGEDIFKFNLFNGSKGGVFTIPLNFFFSKDTGSSLPHVALQYHDIDIKIKLKDFEKLWVSQDGLAPLGDFKIKECKLCIEYIYLDTDERKMFAQSSHEYIIKQTQYSLNNSILQNTTKKTIPLNFFHPVTELIFVILTKSKTITSSRKGNDFFNYSKTDLFGSDTIKNAKIKLNGIDRTIEINNKELRLYYPCEKTYKYSR